MLCFATDGKLLHYNTHKYVLNCYNESMWRQKWPFAVAVRDSPFSFRCSVCNKAISCAHQGERDVSRHADTAMLIQPAISATWRY